MGTISTEKTLNRVLKLSRLENNAGSENMAITPEAGAQVCQAAKVLEPELNPHSHSHAKAIWYAKEVSPTGRKRYRSTSPKPAPLRRTLAKGVLSL